VGKATMGVYLRHMCKFSFKLHQFDHPVWKMTTKIYHKQEKQRKSAPIVTCSREKVQTTYE